MFQSSANSGTNLDAPALTSLVAHQRALPHDSAVEWVFDSFRHWGVEFAGVIRESRFIGLVSRAQLGMLLGSRFGFAVHSRDPILEHMMKTCLAVGAGESLLDVLEKAFGREGEAFYEDVALLGRNDQYLGVIPMATLVRLQNSLLEQQVELARRQQRALQQKTDELSRSLSELRQSQGRYRILLENSALGVALLNHRGDIETRNRECERLLGIEADSQEPLNLVDLVEPSSRATFSTLLLQSGMNGPPSRPGPYDFQLALPLRGRRFFRFFLGWIEATREVCVLLDDVTERRVFERRLAQREKAALLESLVGGIAHELNNKLSPVLGYVDLLLAELQEGSATEPLIDYCSTIRTSATESAKIIRQLLQLSRPASPELGVCDLGQVANEAVALLRHRLHQAQIRLVMQIPPEPFRIAADSSQLKQVVINLGLNAIDAMESSSLRDLRLSVTREQGQGVLTVVDTGQGILPELLGRIFDPFFTTKPPDRGTGLGLSVCYSIVKHHQGDIQVESAPGQGTIVKVLLPLASDTEIRVLSVPPAAGAPTTPRRLQSTPEILVIDDEDFITRMVEEALRRRLGSRVERVHDGRLALARLEAREYDLVISDVRMPGFDGFALVDRLREIRPAVLERFVFMTGDAGGCDLDQRLCELGLPVLRKPFAVEAMAPPFLTASLRIIRAAVVP